MSKFGSATNFSNLCFLSAVSSCGVFSGFLGGGSGGLFPLASKLRGSVFCFGV